MRRISTIRWLDPPERAVPVPGTDRAVRAGIATARACGSTDLSASAVKFRTRQDWWDPPGSPFPDPAHDLLEARVRAGLDEAAHRLSGRNSSILGIGLEFNGKALLLLPEALPFSTDGLLSAIATGLGPDAAQDPGAARALADRTLRQVALAIVAEELDIAEHRPLLDALWTIYEDGLYPLRVSTDEVVLWEPESPGSAGTRS